MDSDEKKIGGGSGGDPPVDPPEDHSDIRYADGTFQRFAPHIRLEATPSSSETTTQLSLQAAGEQGMVLVQGVARTLVITGHCAGAWDANLKIPGAHVFVTDPEMTIELQHGQYGPDSQNIRLAPDGCVYVDAGTSGSILLTAGDSYISIRPAGITIKGAYVHIN
jgi:hypothetical protein